MKIDRPWYVRRAIPPVTFRHNTVFPDLPASTGVAFMPCKLEISCKKPFFSGLCIEAEPSTR